MATDDVTEEDALTEFERTNLPPEYKEYYLAKRKNLCASIQGFRELWELYLLLDRIMMRECSDIRVTNDPNRSFPMLLYFNAHAKIRVSMELGLSGCMAEARSILRDAIESAAHAHHMLKDPKLQITWLEKQSDTEAFKEEFERYKMKRLFDGLPELHKMWGALSESGSHTNIMALCDRFVQVQNGNTIEWRLNYCGVEQEMWVKQLFTFVLTFFNIEQLFFLDYQSRLRLDDVLLQMRNQFQTSKEQLRTRIITRYNIAPSKNPPTP